MITFVEPLAPWLVRPFAQTPLSFLYLATLLNKEGIEAEYVRLRSPEEITRLENSDVVAFGGTTLEHHLVKYYAEMVRHKYPDIIRWYGGPHLTALPDEDFISEIWHSKGIGEAENYIVRMAKDALQGKPEPVYTSEEPVDLDSLPLPDRSLIPGEHGKTIFAFGKNYKGTGNENIITSRGCPFKCAFCSSCSMWGRNVRFRSPENIAEELHYIRKDFGQAQLRFADDSFTTRPLEDLEQICLTLKDLDCVWRCSVRADSLTEDVCKLLRIGGCKEVSLGIESADQRVLNFLDKNTRTEDMLEGIQNASAENLTVRALMMIGTPGEHPDTPERNKELIESSYIDCVTLSTFVPLPGSSIWKNPGKYNCIIRSKDFSKYNRDFWVKTEDGTKEKRKANLLIRNLMLTEARQLDNIRRMEKYLMDTGKSNIG